MTAGSIRLGTYSGIPVRAHWSMALVAVLLGASWAIQLGLVPGLLVALALFASVLAHEFGHALVARRYGVSTQSISLWALGGVAQLDREPPSPRADGLIAVAGPAVSLGLAIVGLGSGLVLGFDLSAFANGIAQPVVATVLFMVGALNSILAVFNMLPGAPLDGGRVLRAIRWWRTGDKYRAMRDAGNAGRVLGWSIAGIGVVLMLNGQFGVFIMIMGIFIAMNARAEIMASHIAERLDGVKVRDLTWFGIAQAGTDMDADSMIWQRQRLGDAGAVAVVDDEGHLDGLVLEDQLWAVPTEQRALVMLTQLMVPFQQLAKASPDDDLAAVLPRLNPLKPVVTVWNDDQFLGIVHPKRLEARLKQAQSEVFPSPAV